MSATIYNDQIRDTDTYSETVGLSQRDDLFQVVNDLDAEITVTFYGTRSEDADATDTTALGSVTVAAGETDFETLTDPWGRAHIEVVASTAPTSGDLAIYRMP